MRLRLLISSVDHINVVYLGQIEISSRDEQSTNRSTSKCITALLCLKAVAVVWMYEKVLLQPSYADNNGNPIDRSIRFPVDAQRSHAHKHVLAHSAHARTSPHHHPRYRLECVCVLEQRALRVSAALMSHTPLPPLPTRSTVLCTCIDHRVWFVLGVVWIICTHTERDEIHHQWHYQHYRHHHHRHWRQQQQQQQPYKQQSRCRCRCRCRKGRC